MDAFRLVFSVYITRVLLGTISWLLGNLECFTIHFSVGYAMYLGGEEGKQNGNYLFVNLKKRRKKIEMSKLLVTVELVWQGK